MLHQSKNVKRSTPPVPYQSGMVATAIFEHVFNDAFTAATDVLEIGSIPAEAQLTAMTVLTDNLAATTTADVGILDGDAGDKDDARDLTADLIYDDLNVAGAATENDATTRDCVAITPARTHRGLGVKLNLDQTASATKKIKVLASYIY